MPSPSSSPPPPPPPKTTTTGSAPAEATNESTEHPSDNNIPSTDHHPPEDVSTLSLSRPSPSPSSSSININNNNNNNHRYHHDDDDDDDDDSYNNYGRMLDDVVDECNRTTANCNSNSSSHSSISMSSSNSSKKKKKKKRKETTTAMTSTSPTTYTTKTAAAAATPLHLPENAAAPAASVVDEAIDVDDQSMTQVLNYIDSYQMDLSWSFLSDSFFIVGGIGYVVMAIWDCVLNNLDDNGDKVDGEDVETNTDTSSSNQHWVYQTMELGAPMVYLFNSMVDMAWARMIQQRSKVKRNMQDTWNDWRITILLEDDCSQSAEEESQQPSPSPFEQQQQQQQHQQQQVFEQKWFRWVLKFCKHAARRRTMMAAFTFGVAAVFAVASVLASYGVVGGKHPHSASFWEGLLEALSVHIYVVSAVIAVSGKRTRPWFGRMSVRNPETLEDLGDLLFFIGSAVDAVLFDFSFADDKPGWPLFSSILWLLDACLYLRADFIMAHRMIVPEEDNRRGALR